MQPTGPESPSQKRRHAAPNPAIVAGVSVALFIASLVAGAVLTGGGHIPSPLDPPESSAAFFAEHAGAVRLVSFLVFASSIPLGIYAATMVSRLRFLGLRVAGVDIAAFGGTAAAVLVALSGLSAWAVAQPGLDGGATRVLHLGMFATGGPGHVATLGLLVAGIGVSAGLGRLIPRGLMIAAIVIAAIAELSTLSLVVAPAMYLLPVARFASLVWIVWAGVSLPASRAEPTP